MATPSTDAGRAPERKRLLDRPLGRILALAVVLAVAFGVSRSCGSNRPDVSSQRAIEIARNAIEFEATEVQVRNAPVSLNQRRVWAVSLYVGDRFAPTRCNLVQVDAETGDVLAVRGC